MAPHIPSARKEDIVRTMSITGSSRKTAALLGVSQRACQRVVKRWREYHTVESPQPRSGRGRPRSLTTFDLEFLEARLEREPDLYLSEMRRVLRVARGVDVCENTIANALRRRGWTYKQLSRPALERSEQRRAEYLQAIGQYPPETLVFVDETACNRHTARRRHGWAPRGDRARRHDFFIRGQRYSILPAISLDGVLYMDILTRSWTADEFRKYLEALLTVMRPFPERNSVLVMDNASVHHFEGIRELVEARGCKLVYLPQYSPDLNPIEEGFSCMKAWIRARHSEALLALHGEDFSDPISMLWEAVQKSMTPENIRGWFYHCGYVAEH